MNSSIIFTFILSYLLLMLTKTSAFTLSNKITDHNQHKLIEKPSALSPYNINLIDEDDDLMADDSNEHEFEKRRFNAWAGKRNLLTKRRFNAWAGRR